MIQNDVDAVHCLSDFPKKEVMAKFSLSEVAILWGE